MVSRHSQHAKEKLNYLSWRLSLGLKRGTMPGTSCKLNVKWIGPYRVTEVIQEAGAELLTEVFTEKIIQRAAEKLKHYVGQEQ